LQIIWLKDAINQLRISLLKNWTVDCRMILLNSRLKILNFLTQVQPKKYCIIKRPAVNNCLFHHSAAILQKAVIQRLIM